MTDLHYSFSSEKLDAFYLFLPFPMFPSIRLYITSRVFTQPYSINHYEHLRIHVHNAETASTAKLIETRESYSFSYRLVVLMCILFSAKEIG